MAYSDVFIALANPTRRHIFESLLAQSLSVGELAANQTVSRPAVSQHLRVLEKAQLVRVQKEGKRKLYSIKREGLEELEAYMNQFWSDVLSAYSAEIERHQSNK